MSEINSETTLNKIKYYEAYLSNSHQISTFKRIITALNKLIKSYRNELDILIRNKKELLKLIDEFFINFSIYDCIYNYCYCGCRDTSTILIFILNRKFKLVKFILSYCFEKKYIKKNCLKFQNFLLYIYGKYFRHLGFDTEENMYIYEWLLTHVINLDIIKNKYIPGYAYCNDDWNSGFAHIMFGYNYSVNNRFLMRIFSFLDGINFCYDNEKLKQNKMYSLMTAAFIAGNNFGIRQLYMRGVTCNSSDLHYAITRNMIFTICKLRYDSYDVYDILEDTFSFDNVNDDDCKNINSFMNLIDINELFKIPISNHHKLDSNDKKYFQDFRFLRKKVSLTIYFNHKLITLIFKEIQNKSINIILYNLYHKVFNIFYPNYYTDDSSLKEQVNMFKETFINKHLKISYEKYVNQILQLYSYGFKPNKKFINLYKNGCEIIKIIYPEIYLKLLKIFI